MGGDSNAIGLFSAFLDDEAVQIVGVEPAGRGLTTKDHAASLSAGKPGTLHSFRSYVLANHKGDPRPVHSIAAGLDYPSVGPEHAYLKDLGRVEYTTVTDEEALEAFFRLSRTEGIIPAIESSHALAYAMRTLPSMEKDAVLLVNLSGRGDKDMPIVSPLMEQM